MAEAETEDIILSEVIGSNARRMQRTVSSGTTYRNGLMMKVLREDPFDGTIDSVMWAEIIYNGADPVNSPRLEVAW